MSQMEVVDIMTADGLCKRCVGALVLIPSDLVSCETVNPSCLPMRAGAELGVGFAFAIVFLVINSLYLQSTVLLMSYIVQSA